MLMRSLREGLKAHARAIKSGSIAVLLRNQLISLYSKHGVIPQSRKLFDEMPDPNVYSWNTIIDAYVKSRNLSRARALFDSCPCKDSVTYNSVISGYAHSDGHENDAFELFLQMHRHDETVKIDEFTLTTVLNLVAKLRALSHGRQVHSLMVRSGNDVSAFALSSLIDMYSKCGCFQDSCFVVNHDQGLLDLVVKNSLIAACCREGDIKMAWELFIKEPELRDDITWNTMIAGCARNGHEKEAVELFTHMAEEGFHHNEHTFGSILSACAALRSLKLGKELHQWVLKHGMCMNPYISSGIVDVYSKCGAMAYAQRSHKAYGGDNIFAITSLIVGYSAKGDMLEARRHYDSLKEKNFVVSTAIITGYVRLQRIEEAFALFCKYVADEKTVPDSVILVSLLGGCSIQASLHHGKQIHAYLLRKAISMDEKASSALMDMYAKCGVISHAERIFEKAALKDTITYNVMIAGYAHNGHEQEALSLFVDMINKGLKPDVVTFIALLSACRHGGLVSEGERYFSSMTEDYGIKPETDHYACMVDLYGRSNELEKVVLFMENMPVEPDSVILSAFLNACRGSKNEELAREAEGRLTEIEGGNGSRFFQLARVYASGGRWDEMGRVMRTMKGLEVKKLAGCSWVQIGKNVHAFTSGGWFHAEAEAIYDALRCLTQELLESRVDEKKKL